MNDPELLRQRRAAETSPEDPRPLYRYRVLALKAGADVQPLPGDQVHVEDGDEEARVVRVRELASGPEEVTVRRGARTQRVGADALKIVSPHRPAVLLGEEELAKRLEEDLHDPHDPRALETLGEVARRNLREGVPHAIDLFARVEEGPDEALRRALTQVCRSRPFGELEVELRHRHTQAGHPEASERDLLELPALAAAAGEEDVAREVLDRLEAMEPEQAARVAVRCGRNLVGAGGPAFVDAELRARVARLSREHPARELRVALFLHAVPALQSDEVLVEKALQSVTPEVRAGAVAELARRGQHEVVASHCAGEDDAIVLGAALRAAPAPAPLALIARCIEASGKPQAGLREQALLRLPEAERGDEGQALLDPWLRKARREELAPALWCAGMLGRPEAADGVLRRLAGLEDLERIGVAVEALARLGHEAAAPALDAWGVALIEAGAWGEEVADVCGLLLGRRVDARELLGRFLVAEPKHLVRRCRALEAASALLAAGDDEARAAARLLPVGLPRYRALEAAQGL
ncbi:MAG: hypothetical protein AB7N76_11035 [Planctomycetota bacterium]